jgi:hypothetical protein
MIGCGINPFELLVVVESKASANPREVRKPSEHLDG